MRSGLLNIGHRGASGRFPENTLSSFRAAIEAGAEMCELDVQMTRDGVAVVIHDDTVDRTTDGHGPVAGLTLVELKRLDAGAKFDRKFDRKSAGDRKFTGERIPTLDEVLAAVKDRCALNIELKAKHSERQVCELMRKYRVLDTSTSTMPSMISSFEWDLLWRARELEPAIQIGMLAEKKPERLIAEAIARRVAAINPRFDLATAELCAQAHRNGLKVYAWTVDAPEAMRALAENGVDGIMTNYPERLRALIAE
ncbi:MAG: glycerophosphodiester phosphodiesterase [Candidatus Binatales bacterium]